MNKIDQLFKDKLTGREETPSPRAWNKLQGQLKAKKQSKIMLYYKIAAAVALVLLSVFAIKRFDISGSNGNRSQSEIAANNFINKKNKKSNEDQNPIPGEQAETAGAGNEEPINLLPGNELAVKPEKKSNPSVLSKEIKINTKANKAEQPETAVPEINVEPEILLAENESKGIDTETNEKTAENFPGITITYKKGKKASPTETSQSLAANSGNENDHSPIKKFLKLAREIREADINLAEIRDSKEELFALEITKQKNQ